MVKTENKDGGVRAIPSPPKADRQRPVFVRTPFDFVVRTTLTAASADVVPATAAEAAAAAGKSDRYGQTLTPPPPPLPLRAELELLTGIPSDVCEIFYGETLLVDTPESDALHDGRRRRRRRLGGFDDVPDGAVLKMVPTPRWKELFDVVAVGDLRRMRELCDDDPATNGDHVDQRGDPSGCETFPADDERGTPTNYDRRIFATFTAPPKDEEKPSIRFAWLNNLQNTTTSTTTATTTTTTTNASEQPMICPAVMSNAEALTKTVGKSEISKTVTSCPPAPEAVGGEEPADVGGDKKEADDDVAPPVDNGCHPTRRFNAKYRTFVAACCLFRMDATADAVQRLLQGGFCA